MKFPYHKPPGFAKLQGGLPLIDIELYYGGRTIPVKALVDSGSSMNILPYDLGLALGLVWEEQTFEIDVSGVLSDTDCGRNRFSCSGWEFIGVQKVCFCVRCGAASNSSSGNEKWVLR